MPLNLTHWAFKCLLIKTLSHWLLDLSSNITSLKRMGNFITLPSFFRNGSQMTANSGSASRRTATTLTPQWSTGTTGLVGSGTWPSTRGGKRKWAPAQGSNPSMCPRISYPGSACTTGASWVSPSRTGAKTEGKPRRRRRLNHRRRPACPRERHRDRSNTGPSTGLDRCQMARHAGLTDTEQSYKWWTCPKNWQRLFITFRPFPFFYKECEKLQRAASYN